ncbi:MAG: lysylphosphatidylglycerol synthase transmembrane domain-containing protein [Gammaproteobacteria bacterium]|nr:flippase-like domain-containing protein [Pseudomonadales bacterium]MCP5329516.1 flippase-like domain-containing protein [Pseudomonadales bacterium]
MRNPWLIAFLLWLVAIVLAVFALRQLPLANLLRTAFQLSLWQLLVWIALNLAILLLSAQRWRELLLALATPVSRMRLLGNRLAGQTISFLTPGPQFGGEPLQVFWLVRGTGVALHRALLSLSLDRLIELWVNFSLLALGIVFVLGASDSRLPQGLPALGALVLLLALSSALLFLLLRRPQRWLPTLKRWCQHWLQHPRLAGLDIQWEQLDRDLSRLPVEHLKLLFRCLLLSLLSWAAILAELWWLMNCAGIHPDPAGFALIAVSIRLAMLLPLPGGIGTIEAAVVWALPTLGAGVAEAATLILLMRSRDVALLICGFIALGRQHRPVNTRECQPPKA